MNHPQTQAPEILGTSEEAEELFKKLLDALRKHREDEAASNSLFAEDYFRLPSGKDLGEFARERIPGLERAQALALAEWALERSVRSKLSVGRGGTLYWVGDPEDGTPSQPEAIQIELEEQRLQIETYHALVRALMNAFNDDAWLRDNLPPDQLAIVERILAGDIPDDDS